MGLKFLVFFVCVGVASAFLASYENCSEKCSIDEIRIDPCNSKKRCTFKLGSNVSISFDFTPSFTATEMLTALYSDQHNAKLTSIGNNGIVDACDLTPCPTEPGNQQLFNYTLHIGKKLPAASYQFRWQLWNKNNEEEYCCFKTNVRLRK
ncbi:MD-2-related lipid-recognition protein-like [Plodia interpunctella]|uniref:MD-2-related lipid-recognition protein-like n=1 Tax=Plodia interpunctella TaxID=58824 RepID=UPI0023679ED4|nr:MD-2-related lipid-recognition protein-like [Plodia interpunctella]